MGDGYKPVIAGIRKRCINSNKNNSYICAGSSLKGEDILFFQKKISYQHNMVT